LARCRCEPVQHGNYLALSATNGVVGPALFSVDAGAARVQRVLAKLLSTEPSEEPLRVPAVEYTL